MAILQLSEIRKLLKKFIIKDPDNISGGAGLNPGNRGTEGKY
jgi:hypothetical protein